MASWFSTSGIARTSARHPWKVLGFWLVLLVLAGVAASGLGDALTTEANFTSRPESVRGDDLLVERLRGERPISETVVIHSDSLTIDDPAFVATVDSVAAGLRAIPDIVASVITYREGGDTLVSPDRHSTIIPVTLTGDLEAATKHVDAFFAVLDGTSSDQIQVLTVGDASMNDELTTIAEEDMAVGERIGIPVAIVILIVVLGALVAAGLPIVLGLVSVFVAVGATAIIGRYFELSFFIVNMIGMIGLAVGIDYALFVISRYREERLRGHAKLEAIEIAGGTASKAVLFSGGTVILALSGMLIAPDTIFRSLGLGAVLVVVIAIVATLMLIPALLSLLGDKIDWPRKPRYDAEAVAERVARDHETIHAGFWGTVTRVVMAHPVVSLALSVTILVGLALPYLDVEIGSVGVSGLPEGTETRSGYDILTRDFADGLISPVEIVVDGSLADASVQSGIGSLIATLASDSRFGPATITVNPAGDLALVSVPMTIAPDSPQAYATIDELRRDIVPVAFQGANAEVLVTGLTAFNTDFNHQSSDYTPKIFIFVLGLSFILLMIAFRSVVVPAKAILMNLLSVGAAYGSIVLVFQKGVGADLLGFQQVEAIESWLPIFLFCVLFGLSMDYHVFLLSRIRERYDQTQRNAESVAVGLQATAKLITGAALIMVAVFSGFAAGRLVSLQQVGFGLAIAVLLDATIVRSILVPASMALLGDRNWYLPGFLTWLPTIQIEGKAHPVLAPMRPAALSTSGDD